MQLKSLFITISSCLLTAASASAQGSWKVGLGFSPGVATGDVFENSVGGDLRVEKTLNSRVTGTFSAGYTHFFEKDQFIGFTKYGSPYDVIPVKAGIKYFVSQKFYLGGEAGAGFGFERWGTSFLWSPSAGLAFNNGLDLSLRYEDYTKSAVTKTVALRLGYNISTQKLPYHAESEAPNGWQLETSLVYGDAVSGNQGKVLGGEIGLSRHLTRNIEALVTTGFTYYFRPTYNFFWNPYATNSDAVRQAARQIIPIRAGLRAYAGNHFYAGAEAGAAIGISSPTQMVVAPSLGLNLNQFDFGVRYDCYKEYYQPNVLSLKLGYKFKL